MRQRELSQLRDDVHVLVEHDAAREAAKNAGPSISEQIQELLASPDEVAAALAWDAKYLGEGSPDCLALEGLDEDARGDALEEALAA
jgi:predicted ester cyclase